MIETTSMHAPLLGLRQRLELLISGYWLPLGYLVLLTGLFWLPERSFYSKLYYALIALPALLTILNAPQKSAVLLREPIIVCFLLFSAWLIVSLAWSDSDHSHSSLAKRPLYVLMLFVACTTMAVSRGNTGLSLERTLLAGALATTLGALYNLWPHSDVATIDGRLIGSGSLSSPLLTSHLLGMFGTYWLARWFCSQQPQVLAVVCGAILFAAVLATGSRTPLLALTGAGLWLAVTWRTRKAFLLLAALAIGVLLLLSLTPDMLTQRGLSFRPEIWSQALRQITEHLWLGQGYASPQLFVLESPPQQFSDPHNVELAVALELGIVGLLLWGLMYAAAFVACIRQRGNAEFTIASALLVYGLMAGMTEGSNFLSRPNESWFMIWIPLALVASLSIRIRTRQERIG